MWVLNFYLARIIPFNIPHKIVISDISKDETIVLLPYKTKNLNHLKTLHACSLATACEYVAGLTLLRKLDIKKYRIILKTMEVDYHYRAQTDVSAKALLDAKHLQSQILNPLKESDAIEVVMESKAYDRSENLVCTSKTRWQIKSWSAIKAL